MTDLSSITAPDRLVEYLQRSQRSETILQHSVRITPGWWVDVLQEAEANEAVVRPDGEDAEGSPTLSRSRLFELAKQASSAQDDEAVPRLFWHILAWGTGTGARNNRRRVRAVTARQAHVVDVLRDAMQLSRTEPADAYALFRPTRRNVVPWLGPAFFTKVLYFAGQGESSHKALILDDRVAGALRDRCGWESLRTGGGWPVSTYARYIDLLDRWAADLAAPVERAVAPDEIERWLFSKGPQQVRRS